LDERVIKEAARSLMLMYPDTVDKVKRLSIQDMTRFYEEHIKTH